MTVRQIAFSMEYQDTKNLREIKDYTLILKLINNNPTKLLDLES